jgi:hypothetical protein
MIETVLSRREFSKRPPVLLDIGAAGVIHPKWKRIARHSVCIAFDADERELAPVMKETGAYRKLHVYNCAVTDGEVGETNVYFTRSPHCSSLLKPDNNRLKGWAFSDLFAVERMAAIKTTRLSNVLEETGVGKIDWFKTDSQGTDLRLFRSLGETHVDRVLVAEFEPGIIDAYEGEDKLWRLIAYMESRPFWMADLVIKGSQRVRRESLSHLAGGLVGRVAPALLKTSPGWGEVTYMNAFAEDDGNLDERDFLLGWVFAVVEKQYGFAMEVASRGFRRFGDPVFLDLERDAMSRIRRLFFRLPRFLGRSIGDALSRFMRLGR